MQNELSVIPPREQRAEVTRARDAALRLLNWTLRADGELFVAWQEVLRRDERSGRGKASQKKALALFESRVEAIHEEGAHALAAMQAALTPVRDLLERACAGYLGKPPRVAVDRRHGIPGERKPVDGFGKPVQWVTLEGPVGHMEEQYFACWHEVVVELADMPFSVIHAAWCTWAVRNGAAAGGLRYEGTQNPAAFWGNFIERLRYRTQAFIDDKALIRHIRAEAAVAAAMLTETPAAVEQTAQRKGGRPALTEGERQLGGRIWTARKQGTSYKGIAKAIREDLETNMRQRWRRSPRWRASERELMAEVRRLHEWARKRKKGAVKGG